MIVSDAIWSFWNRVLVVLLFVCFGVIVESQIGTAAVSDRRRTLLDLHFEWANVRSRVALGRTTETVSTSHLVRVVVLLADRALDRMAGLERDLWQLGQEHIKGEWFCEPLMTVPIVFYRHFWEKRTTATLLVLVSDLAVLEDQNLPKRIGLAHNFNKIIFGPVVN